MSNENADAPLALPADPIAAFRLWFQEAEAAKIHEPNAMTLATSTPDGRPRARIVLMKGIAADGLDFFTNYESRKGQELAANPFAALTFHWKELTRQIRFEGRTDRLSAAESDVYFQTRPRGSRIGAWASPQSRPIRGREDLLARIKEVESRFPGETHIPCPPHWGGFRLRPERVEFWEERPFRLHERIVFETTVTGAWTTSRLAP
jgi:pyridoxamine 5'-phosphate oxidase